MWAECHSTNLRRNDDSPKTATPLRRRTSISPVNPATGSGFNHVNWAQASTKNSNGSIDVAKGLVVSLKCAGGSWLFSGPKLDKPRAGRAWPPRPRVQ